MSHIIAGDPAPTNLTAHEDLRSALAHSRFLQDPEGMASVAIDALLDAYRAEVLTEAQARLDETFRLAPLAERASGINFAIGVLMSLRGESRG
ncbi:hypothetical protein OHA37_26750 [Streptomyces sp. NBC_00335]|uniref:hypothetical protein n=1 Tax=unclassified Streptomyces TaxID=2593676 RepID=UPI002253D5A5|nr:MULTISPECIES: hypothetical protein [unclassified Streptomyces]MCX5407449.1 hypothetical protein [Streptomyces sp. NBC_00086]